MTLTLTAKDDTISSASSIQQGVATISGTGTALDGTDVPVLVGLTSSGGLGVLAQDSTLTGGSQKTQIADANNPTRAVQPDGVSNNTVNAASALAIGTSATQIRPAALNRQLLTVTNEGSVDVYLGLSGVTGASNGKVLHPGASLDIKSALAIYAIVASGSGTVSYWEELA